MILHQFWAQGEAKLPAAFAENRARWRTVLPPAWEMRLWDDVSARAQWSDYHEVSDLCMHHATRADLALARAQRDFGGLAMGTDVIPHNTDALFAFIEVVDSFVVANISSQSASNGLSWFVKPKHPFICCVCRHQLRNRGALASHNVWLVTGPGCWYQVLRRYMWELAMVTDKLAYTRSFREPNYTNKGGWVDPGYAKSWHKKTRDEF